MARSNHGVSVLLACAALSVPRPGLAAKKDVVATVNGAEISVAEYRRALNGELEDWPDAARDPALMADLREKALDGLIDEELLYQESLKRGVAVSPEDMAEAAGEIKARFYIDESGARLTPSQAKAAFYAQLQKDGRSEAEFMERVRKQAAGRKLVKKEVSARLPAPAQSTLPGLFAQISAYAASASTEAPAGFDEDSAVDFLRLVNNVHVAGTERAKVSRILIRLPPSASEAETSRAFQKISEIHRELTSGASTFAQLGGKDFGYVSKKEGPPDLEKTAFSLDAGQLSAPFRSPEGWNVIRIDARLAAVPPDYEQLKGDLAKLQRRLDFHAALQDYLASLRGKARIEVDNRLP